MFKAKWVVLVLRDVCASFCVKWRRRKYRSKRKRVRERELSEVNIEREREEVNFLWDFG